MAFSSTLDDRQLFLRWLTHGGELARERKGERARHSDVVWSLIVEAIDTLDRLPDQERSWLTSGTRSGGWNMVGMTPADLREIERIRILSSIKPFDGVAKYSPQKDDTERALGVLEWMRWCNQSRNAKRLTKAAIILARNGETDAVHRVYNPHRKANRQTIYEIKMMVCGYILNGLKREHGLVPGQGLTFMEVKD